MLIREQLAPFVAQITSNNHRVLTVTLTDQTAAMEIAIVETYAPNQKYKTDIKDRHWGAVRDTNRKIHKSHLVIWDQTRLGNSEARKRKATN